MSLRSFSFNALDKLDVKVKLKTRTSRDEIARNIIEAGLMEYSKAPIAVSNNSPAAAQDNVIIICDFSVR